MNAGAGVEAGSRLPRLGGLLVAVIAAWLAQPVIEFDFVEFDDGINLLFNRHLGPLSSETVAWAFSDMDQMRRYVPLGWLGCAAVYGVSGLSPAGYHAAGALLHVLNAVLVYSLLLALLRRFARETPEPWRPAWALLGALGWALHPLRAETLGWASGLFYGLATALALSGALAYLRAWQPGAHRGPWVAASAALVCASTLTYPMSLGVAAALVLLDFALLPAAGWPERRRLLLEKAWFVVPTGVVIALTFIASYTAPAYWVRPPAWEEFGPGARLLQAAAAWGHYLWRPWWPFSLTPVVDWMYEPGNVRTVAGLSLAVLAGISAALLAGGRRWRGPAVAWFAHAALLAPLLGFFERPYFPADRYHLLAGVVLAAALVVAAARAGPRIRIPVALAAGVAVAALAVAQQAQLRIWTNTDTLFARIVAQAKHPTVRREYQERWVGYHSLRGRMTEARAVARQAGLATATFPTATPEAIPPIATWHLKLAHDFESRGRRREALEHLETALTLAPDWRTAAYNLAVVRALDGAWPEALRLARRALAAGPAEPVPVAGRQRLLLLVAEGAFAAGQARSAAALVTLARRESGDGSGATAELERDLQAAAARYGAGERR